MRAPTTSGGTTFGPGTANNLLKSNGTSIYWSTLATSDIPTISITDKTSGTLTVARGGTGQTSIANIQAGKDGDGNTISSTYLKLSGGDLTGDLGIIFGDTDKFLHFKYNTSSLINNSWRLGVLGTGSSDANYFVIQSGGVNNSTNGTWANAIRIGQQTYDAAFGGNVYPLTNNSKTLGTSSNKWSNIYATTFTGNLTGNVTGTLSTTRITLPGITGTGTTGADQGSSNTSTRYKPAVWTFSVGITPVDGDIITIKQPCAGHDYGTWLTLDNGTSYHPVVYNASSRITTHFENGKSLTLCYDSNGTASVFAVGGAMSRTTATGVWRVWNTYDSNSNDTGYYHRRIYPNLKAGGAIHPYSIIMQLPNGRWSGITTTAPNNPVSGTISPVETGKTASTSGYVLGHVLVMYARATYTDGNNIATYNIWSAHTGLIDARYSFNLANSTGNGFTAYTPVYIVGTLNDSGLFVLDSTKWWTQTLPTTNDGKIYIYIGDAYDWYRLTFTEDKPIYWFKDGKLQLYSGASTYSVTSGSAASVAWANITSKPLTLTAATTGFTIAGGTTSKTLTVSENATLKGGTSTYLAYYSASNTISGHSYAHFSDTYSSSTKNGKNELVLGNATASTSNGSAYGQLALYSSGTKGTYLATAANSTEWYTATLPAASGTIAYTTSNITGTAANVTGTVEIDHGGTGATTAAAARVNLGLGTATNNFCINANANGSSETLSMAYTVDNSNNVDLNGHSLRFLIRRGGLQLLDGSTNFSACWTLETRQGRASVTAGNGSVKTTSVSFGEGKSFPTASYYVVATVYSNVLARIRDVRIGTDNYTTDGFDITAVSTSGSELTNVPVNWIAILQ